ncbi:peptidylprolyl isomerase [Paragemmobacter ruber]|uniref:Parvulin-like PPIase n=1 Tax=Paragemmobacter ruber TaxID=1985673 RepID=A0ABW9Y721_9RHOB|nr:peptidylprolyl isomerase [Rhodobacter ruber]NBE08372.1 peptidylprolyl isomerase [Rhodobacter ruber]
MTDRPRIKTAKALRAALLGASLVMAGATVAPAQDGGLFAPRLIINGQTVTNFEVEQRTLMLRALRSPGDPEKEALVALMRDRLGAQAAEDLGITVTAEQVTAGMEEFAARANLTAAQFTEALGQEGVAPETFRDFVANGVLWREVVRARFASQIRITEAQIDRALAENAKTPQVQVLLSELILPVQGEDVSPVLDQARGIKAQTTSEGSFAAAAREFSASPSAQRGGRLDWLPVTNLPPAIAQKVLTLSPGEVSDPIVVPQAVVLFQLNGVSDQESAMPAQVEVQYAQFALPPTLDPAVIRQQSDGCGDLYPLAAGLPADQLRVTTQMMGAVPQDIALELAKLDPGESVLRNRGSYNELLMLCLRTGIPEAAPEAAEIPVTTVEGEEAEDQSPVDREAVRNQLGNQQLTAMAEAFMEELRSEAIIEER